MLLRSISLLLLLFICWVGNLTAGQAYSFALPTPNRDILSHTEYTNYFVPTAVGTWRSGTFGCVRSQGRQFHEGIDIRSKTFDKRGEAADPITAVADGIVVYINNKSWESSFGRYVVLKHNIDGIELYSLYAHLASIDESLKKGMKISSGTKLGIMGRSDNTRSGIPKSRAHLHLELGLYMTPHFISWFKAKYPSGRNVHGDFMGWNLSGLDPWKIYYEQWTSKEFNLAQFIRNETEMCRVLIHKSDFPFAERYPLLVKNPKNISPDKIAGWEISFNFSGVPILCIPQTASAFTGNNKPYTLLAVNAQEARQNPAKKYLKESNQKWDITKTFIDYLDMLTWQPKP